MKKCARLRTRHCIHCGRKYTPDHRAARRQKYCKRPKCQKARRRRTARIWRKKNRTKVHEADILRIRVWRAGHRYYWRKHRRKWLALELFLPAVLLRRTRFWAKVTRPKTGALRILNLVQRPDGPCVLQELFDALRISMGHVSCPGYPSAICRKCAGRPEKKLCRKLMAMRGSSKKSSASITRA